MLKIIKLKEKNMIELFQTFQDDEPEYSEIGLPIKNYFEIEFKIECKIPSICDKCQHENILEYPEPINFCEKCDEFLMDNTLDDIKSDCDLFNIEVLESREIQHKQFEDAEIIKFKLHNLYGIVLCGINWEGNSWSSSPHNNFLRKFIIYDNQEQQEQAFQTQDVETLFGGNNWQQQ